MDNAFRDSGERERANTDYQPLLSQETAWSFQLPRTDFRAGSYNSRDFLNPSNHLGEDSSHSHFSPIYAIANGVVRVSQPATGYGRAVVIEHKLPDGTYVNSIYGHLCSHQGYPTISNGSFVTKGQLIGYIGSDIENGDGSEHLHLGIRKGQYDGYFCGYTGLPQCTAAHYFRPTEFINARRTGMSLTSGILLSPSSPAPRETINFRVDVVNNFYYGGNFEFRMRVLASSNTLSTSPVQTIWLNPGNSTTLTFNSSFASPGTYQAVIELRAPGTETWWPIAPSSSAVNPRTFTVSNTSPSSGTCSVPLTISANGGIYTGSTSGSGTNKGTCGGATAPEKVYRWTPASSGTWKISTCGSSFDTVLYITANSCSTTDLACSDNSTGCNGSASGNASSVTITVTAGRTYYIFVDGRGNSAGSYRLSVARQ